MAFSAAMLTVFGRVSPLPTEPFTLIFLDSLAEIIHITRAPAAVMGQAMSRRRGVPQQHRYGSQALSLMHVVKVALRWGHDPFAP